MPFDMEFFIKRNHDVAIQKYGELLDENRCVKGTDIWFDACWRMHKGGGPSCSCGYAGTSTTNGDATS